MKTYISNALIVVAFLWIIINYTYFRVDKLPEAISYNFTPKDTTWKQKKVLNFKLDLCKSKKHILQGYI